MTVAVSRRLSHADHPRPRAVQEKRRVGPSAGKVFGSRSRVSSL